jgi:hypothetical protein
MIGDGLSRFSVRFGPVQLNFGCIYSDLHPIETQVLQALRGADPGVRRDLLDRRIASNLLPVF